VAGGIAELRRVAAGDEPMVVAAALFNLGNALEDNDDLAGALDAYEKAADIRQPRFSGQAAINLGVILAKQMDVRGAHAAYRLAVEVGDPDDVAKGNRMLALLAGLGELDEVHARAQELDLSDPDLIGESALFAGQQFLQDGNLQAAIRAFEKAMDTAHPIHAPEGAAWVAVAFHQMEGMRGAKTAIGQLSEIGRPDLTPRAWFMFGCRLVNGGRLKDVERLWKQLITSGGDVPQRQSADARSCVERQPRRRPRSRRYSRAPPTWSAISELSRCRSVTSMPGTVIETRPRRHTGSPACSARTPAFPGWSNRPMKRFTEPDHPGSEGTTHRGFAVGPRVGSGALSSRACRWPSW
jgi:tetratricopeptide (TPR) repeat protein